VFIGVHWRTQVEASSDKLQHPLNGVQAAAKALGDSTNRGLTTVKKRVLSAAGRCESEDFEGNKIAMGKV